MRDYKEDYKNYKAELSKIEPIYLALQETVKGLEKLIKVTEDASPVEEDFHLYIEGGTLDGLSTKDAALKILYLAKVRLTSKQIADLAETAGYEHTSTNLPNAFNTALTRLAENEHKVGKEDNKWYLTGRGAEHVGKMLLVSPQASLVS